MFVVNPLPHSSDLQYCVLKLSVSEEGRVGKIFIQKESLVAFVYDVSKLVHFSVMARYLERSNNNVLLPDQSRFHTFQPNSKCWTSLTLSMASVGVWTHACNQGSAKHHSHCYKP